MLRSVRRALFSAMQTAGALRLIASSRWRQQRLLILCYHGISLQDEHLWRPLYMKPAILQRRLEIIQRGGYQVLPLGKALPMVRLGKLPPRSLVITFDDGMYDFHKQAHPLLKSFGYPVTVYQSTYYSNYQKPIFDLIVSYMLWRRRGEVVEKPGDFGSELALNFPLSFPLDLRTGQSREQIVGNLLKACEARGFSGEQKNQLAEHIARVLDIDYAHLLAKRMFHLMTPQEIKQLSGEGIDFQLHTHRHRTPADELHFRQEVRENRRRLTEATNHVPVHFCYPSGVYRPEFENWLRVENVVSAVTCDAGLVTPGSNPMYLNRFVDSGERTEAEFEAWLSGAGSLFALRKRAGPQEGSG
jgi:peptidoglycan/xylan/chitin deacetylase (PgdA/CDA1 family)